MHPQLAEDIVGNLFRKPFLSAGLQGIAIDLRIKRIEYFLKLLQIKWLSSGRFTLQAAKLENKFHFCTCQQLTLQLQHRRLYPFCIDLQENWSVSIGLRTHYYRELAGEEVHVREMEQFERAWVAVGDGAELAGTGH